MSENDPDGAMARIERALTRIETAARKANADRAEIARRHRTLRAEIRDTIAALDTMIAGETEEPEPSDDTPTPGSETAASADEAADRELTLWQK